MKPSQHQTPARVQSILALSRAGVPFFLGALIAFAPLTGCSFFGSRGGGMSDTATVPLPGSSENTAGYDFEEQPDPLVRDPLLIVEESDSADATGETAKATSKSAAKPDPVPLKRRSTADAWAAPRSPVTVSSNSEIPALTLSNPSGPSSVSVPIPTTEKPSPVEPENAGPLSLAEFRKKVFAVQKAQEMKRFRDAVGEGLAGGRENVPDTPGLEAKSDPEPAVTDPLADAVADAFNDSAAPKAEPVTTVAPGSPDAPKTKAAYQVFRWNLMETLAGAERAYWTLHFAQRQFGAVEESVNTLAAINDKARIGVLRKARIPTDIAITERIRANRKISVAEFDAKRTAAMSEAMSYYLSPDSGSLVAKSPLLTEPPAKPNPPSSVESLVAIARKTHPLYMSERTRVENPENPESAAAKAEIDALDERLEKRIQDALDRLRSAEEAISKTRVELQTFEKGLDENLRNYGSGKINTDAITSFEKNLLASRQAHINALLDYQNALLDLELEVGDFLATRGQEVPLATLLAD